MNTSCPSIPALEEKLPLLFDFLEVPEVGGPAPAVAPEVRLSRLFEALRRVTQRRSEQEVLLFLAEDLHWFDPQSEAFLERVIESFPGSRTLVVANFRPEFSAAWMRHSYYRQLAICPLAGSGSERPVGPPRRRRQLARCAGRLRRRTHRREPVLRRRGRACSRRGRHVGRCAGCLPAHSSAARREGSRQRAGGARRAYRSPTPASTRMSSRRRPSSAAPSPSRYFAMRRAFGRRRHRGDRRTVRRRAVGAGSRDGPAPEYRFWHPLTQEVAYRSLLSARRARLHGAVARAWVAADSAATTNGRR